MADQGHLVPLYVIIDIFAGFNPSWIVSPVEDSELTADFIAEAIERNGVVPHTLHADRGTSMTSKPVSAGAGCRCRRLLAVGHA